jgi:catechol 2,3-dioxygenase-like lactoylglutathione lyase family enzyme
MPQSILHHVSVGVADIAKARAFYGKVMGALGYSEKEVVDLGQGPVGIAYGADFPEFWIGYPDSRKPASAGDGVHIAFIAPSQAAVDAFHAAAMKAGGKDEGAPGLRPHYTPDYYAAFVRDLDGNKIEAVFMASMANMTEGSGGA